MIDSLIQQIPALYIGLTKMLFLFHFYLALPFIFLCDRRKLIILNLKLIVLAQALILGLVVITERGPNGGTALGIIVIFILLLYVLSSLVLNISSAWAHYESKKKRSGNVQ